MLSWEKVMGITFSRKCIQFSCFLFSSTHLRWIWFVWFRAHTLILVDLDNICYIWGSGCPPRWNNLLAVAFILFTHSEIFVITEWAGKHTHVQHMCSLCYLELEGMVCVVVFVYMRGDSKRMKMHTLERETSSHVFPVYFCWPISAAFNQPPRLFCWLLYCAVTLGLVKAGLIILLNVIYVLERFARKVNAKHYYTM